MQTFGEQTSWIAPDTLRFDGGFRSLPDFLYYSGIVQYDVSFDACLPTPYHIRVRADCPGVVFLRLEDPSGPHLEIGSCRPDSLEIDQSGVLIPGACRLQASLRGNSIHRLSFTVVFGTPAEGTPSPTSAPP